MKRKALTVASALAAATCVVLPAGPASADTPRIALPVCNMDAYQYNWRGEGWLLYFPASTSGTHCILHRGHVTAGVFRLQNALNNCYRGEVSKIVEDHDFGGATEQALISVQMALGITADGRFGPETARSMNFPVYYNANTNSWFCEKIANYPL